MSSIDAPVVPRIFAATAPMANKRTFFRGVALPLILRWILPAMTKSEPMRTMKLTYSISVCTTFAMPSIAKM